MNEHPYANFAELIAEHPSAKIFEATFESLNKAHEHSIDALLSCDEISKDKSFSATSASLTVAHSLVDFVMDNFVLVISAYVSCVGEEEAMHSLMQKFFHHAAPFSQEEYVKTFHMIMEKIKNVRDNEIAVDAETFLRDFTHTNEKLQ